MIRIKEEERRVVTQEEWERMFDEIPNDFAELPLKVVNKAFENIMSKCGRKYKFYKNAGYSPKMAIVNLFHIVWKTMENRRNTFKNNHQLKLATSDGSK